MKIDFFYGQGRGEIPTFAGRRWIWIILTVTLLLYFRSFYSDWTLDDLVVIVNNPDITSLTAFWQDSYPGRPLRELTFLVDRTLFGMVPGGWHIQSILWHACCGVLVYRVVQRLGGSSVAAGIASLLFVVHPLQVEAVANLANRKESLALCLSLSSLLAYARSFDNEVHDRRWRWRWAALVLAGIGMLAKQTAVMVPCAWVLWEAVAVESERRWLLSRPLWLAVGVGGAVLGGVIWFIGFGGMEIYLATAKPVMAKMGKSFAGDSLLPYLLLMLKSWSYMLAKIVWPSALAPEYVFAAPAGWGNGWVITALVLVLASLAALFWAVRRQKGEILFGLGWFWLFWLPVTNLWPVAYFAADRYFYAPLVGVVVMLVLLVERSRLPAVAVRSGCVLIVAALALVTWQQIGIWQNQRTLWSRAVEVSPTSTTALTNLGLVCLEAGEYDQARELLERATRNMNDPIPYFHLGKLYRQQGNMARSRSSFRTFLAFNDARYPQELLEARRFILIPEQ